MRIGRERQEWSLQPYSGELVVDPLRRSYSCHPI
jgi:hypothetical protein